MTSPRISILMCTFNGEATITEAIESILDQTFTDFEFIIIDDGSTDGTMNILDTFRERDPRIKIYGQENRGLTRALNYGLSLCSGEFVARQDDDDRSLPSRIERQLNFLELNTDMLFVGTNGFLLGETRKRYATTSKPAADKDIRSRMRKHNQFIHTSILMRKSAVDSVGGYDVNFRTAQDYELWLRLLEKGAAANLEEPLVELFQGGNRISKKHARKQVEASLRAKWKNRKGSVLKNAPWYLFWWQLRGLLIPPGTLDSLRARRS